MPKVECTKPKIANPAAAEQKAILETSFEGILALLEKNAEMRQMFLNQLNPQENTSNSQGTPIPIPHPNEAIKALRLTCKLANTVVVTDSSFWPFSTMDIIKEGLRAADSYDKKAVEKTFLRMAKRFGAVEEHQSLLSQFNGDISHLPRPYDCDAFNRQMLEIWASLAKDNLLTQKIIVSSFKELGNACASYSLSEVLQRLNDIDRGYYSEHYLLHGESETGVPMKLQVLKDYWPSMQQPEPSPQNSHNKLHYR
jgi:hypothetical protein